MKPYLATVLVVLTAAGGATVRAGSGDQWVPADEAIEPVAEDEASDYELAMEEGDAAALLAAGGAASPATIKKKIELAVRAYERAAKADPKAAEPHYRAGNVLYGFYLDCEMGPLCDNDNPRLFRRVLEHWHAFETRAPLDPRVNAILFDRAILHTKLATEDDLRAAVLDYQALLDRSTQNADVSTVYGNLAESHMMLGDLDQAIPSYQEALRAGGQTSIAYGLAVAYDRDDQGAKAREIFAAYGEDQFEAFREEINRPDALTFFVPEGEEFYYLALGYESLGRDAEAVTAWKRFIASGAHPSYQPRAKEHLTKLKAKLKAAGGK